MRVHYLYGVFVFGLIKGDKMKYVYGSETNKYFVIDLAVGTIAEYLTKNEANKLCENNSRRIAYPHI